MLILLAEDDMLLSMMLEMTLRAAGHEVLGPVDTVAQALSIANDRRPELALINIDLRDGDSGVTLARELRRTLGVRSLFVSGSHNEAHANQDAVLGYLAKPYQPDAVVATVEVARHILEHTQPPPSPPGLTLFTRRA